MLLTTRCPYCHTGFRIAPDQLKQRQGLVRCGRCMRVFNGVDNQIREALSPPTQTPELALAVAIEAAMASRDALADIAAETNATPAATPDAGADAQAIPLVQDVQPETAATSSTTHREDVAATGETGREAAPVVAADDIFAPADATPPSGTDRKADEDVDEDGFAASNADMASSGTESVFDESASTQVILVDELVGHPPPVAATPAPRRRWPVLAGIAIALPLLLAQAALFSRDLLARAVPASIPTLRAACAWLDCQLAPLAHAEAWSIQHSDLQQVPNGGNVFLLTVVLKNTAAYAVVVPDLELTLADTGGNPAAVRVLTPRDFLSKGQTGLLTQGVAPQAEVSVALPLELRAPAVSYRVLAFYP